MAPPPRSNLPDRVILGYWAAVRKFLQKNHNLEEKEASKAIARYRAVLSKSRVGDIMYHAPIADTANGIVIGGHLSVVESIDIGKAVKKPKRSSPSQPTIGLLQKRKRRVFSLASRPMKSQKSTKPKVTKRRGEELPKT